ncbi:tyrosine-type recombinase/integrase [Occallatibacter savannae]|uniref:tyrosine-type recombinase/integrase n=1 Tax=Occallatibacter savannae TaxID=1002691 RepID=UPI000D689940|nr:tyrosine-type recombinase/integrase [Occallatibacter savannae]
MKRKREQSGQIFQSHGAWFVRFYESRVIDGEVKRVRVSKQLAEVTTRGKVPPHAVTEQAKDLVAEVNRPRCAPQNVVKLGDFVEKVYFPRVEQRLRPSTLKTYRDIWMIHLKPRCAQVWIKDVRTYNVQNWMDDIALPSLLGRHTLKHIKSSLSAIFKLAKQQGYFAGENPVRDTAIDPAVKEPAETYAYSLSEIRAMLAVLPEPAATIFAVAAFTGLRRGEIRGMRWEDLRNGEIHVNQSIWEGHTTKPKTNLSMAAVPVIKPLGRMLEAHRMRSGSPESGPVFAAVNGKAVSLNNVLTRSIKPALKGAGLGELWHGWHAARRGLGSNLYALGVPEKTIQVILRHANVSTTSTYYIKSAPADAVAAMDRLETALPELGSDWAADESDIRASVAVN